MHLQWAFKSCSVKLLHFVALKKRRNSKKISFSRGLNFFSLIYSYVTQLPSFNFNTNIRIKNLFTYTHDKSCRSKMDNLVFQLPILSIYTHRYLGITHRYFDKFSQENNSPTIPCRKLATLSHFTLNECLRSCVLSVSTKKIKFTIFFEIKFKIFFI